MTTRFAAFAAAAALFAVPATAMANTDNSAEFTVMIEYGDLDLTNPEDVSRLDARIRTHIRQKCQIGGRDSVSIRAERKCRAAALAQTEAQVRLAVVEANSDRPRLAYASVADGAHTPSA